jgi:hypothetical protein
MGEAVQVDKTVLLALFLNLTAGFSLEAMPISH